MPGGLPRPAHARDQRRQRGQQERDVDRRRAEGDQGPDRGRVAAPAAGRGRRRRSSRRPRRSGPCAGRPRAGSATPGTAPSRATEYIVRAVTDWAAMPQDRNATSTIAANGFDDHEPNELTTAVVTGSTSSPATTDAGSGCASSAATALRITSAPTLSSAIQIALGTCRAASFVSSATPTAQSNPMNTHPPTASAASSPAATEPPDSASAPKVSVKIERSCSAKTSSSARPMPDRRDDLRRDARLHRPAQHADPERAGERADHDQHHAGDHDRVGGRLDVEQRQRPGRAEVGDRRVRRRVRADRDPARRTSRRSRRSGGGSTGRRRPRSGTRRPAPNRRPAAGTGRRARPAAPRPTRGPRPASRPARRRRARRPAISRRSRARRCRRSAGAGRAPACSRARPSRAASASVAAVLTLLAFDEARDLHP